ncbi:MAG: cytochrome c [Pacificimonas sp.]|jgi:mono/diheme cytochrome c family protein|nr:cytochrome c [Pacificimonas sp.]
MRAIGLSIFVGAAALLTGACVTSAAPMSEAAQAAKGRDLAAQYCASCHSIYDGTSPHPDAPSFADAANRYPPDMLAESLAEGIQVGHPDMPVFELDEESIDALVAYLWTLRDDG